MNPRKILLIRFSSIGDVVLVAPVVAALKEHFPDAEIHLLTKKAIAPIWAGDKRVRVRFFDPENAHFGLPGFTRYVNELRAENYDVVIDLHGLPKTRALTAALGAKTLRYAKASWARRSYVRSKKPPTDVIHTARRYVRALAPLGINTDLPLVPLIDVADGARNRVGAMVQGVGINGREMVAIAPGSQWATKQWGWENFAQLVDRLNRRGTWVALVGGKEERERCEEMAMGKKALNFAGLLDLQETLALMEFCRLMVTNDSGPMHMAGARGADVIAIFGSTTRELGFWPLAQRSSIVDVAGLPCRPCSPHGREACPEGHFKCMKEIGVDRVWLEIERFLGPPPPPPGAQDNEGIFYLGKE